MNLIRSFLLMIIILFISDLFSKAQNVLTGKITDAKDGSPLPGATVNIPDLKTGAVTDVDGNYIVNNLPNGNYLLTVSYVGYAMVFQRINVSGSLTKDFALSASILEHREVIVTGVSTATERRRSPTPITVVNKIELLEVPSTNLIDALSRVPGVSQVTTGPGISKPQIRGLGYNRVVVVNDGMRQEGQQWGDEHGVEIDEYAANRVEVLKGAGNIMYGSDALAGVINILSPDPVAEGKIMADLLGNYQTNNGLIGYSASITGNQKGMIWLGRFSGKMAHDYQNKYDGFVFNSRFRETAGSGYLGLNKSWGYSHLNFSIYHFEPGLVEGDRDEAGNFIKQIVVNDSMIEEVAVPEDDFKSYLPYIPKQGINHYKLSLMNNIYFGSSKIYVNVGYENNRRKEYGDVIAPDDYGLYFYLNTIPYDIRLTLPYYDKWDISFGLNGMFQSNRNKGIEFLIPDYDLFDLGIFVFAHKDFNRLSVSGGLRYDHRDITTESLFLNGNDEPVPVPDSLSVVKFNGEKSGFSAVSGIAGLSYEFSDQWITKINFSRGFRAPNIAEIGANGRHEGTFRFEIGNPDLKAETSWQADAGTGFNSMHLSAEMDIFFNSISNYIFPEKLNSTQGGDSLIEDEGDLVPVYRYTQGSANIYGGEISVDIHPHPLDWLHFENTLSYVSSIQKDQPDSTKYLPFTPAPKITSELRGNFKKVSKGLRNGFVSVSLQYDFEQNRVYSAYGTESPTPSYTLLNAGIGTDFFVKEKKVCTLIILVTNLTDVAYQDHLSRLKYAPENPATGRVGVFNMGRNVSIKLNVPIGIKG